MTATFAARASRQSVILAVISGLHVGAFLLIASVRMPPPFEAKPPQPPIRVFLPPPIPIPVVAPVDSEPLGFNPIPVPPPPIEIPRIEATPPLHVVGRDPTASAAGSGPVVPVEVKAPTLRTRDSRLAALIDSCYPTSSRRLGEEGRAVARVVIDAQGRATAWTVDQSSGFPRLDAAMDCVIRRLKFVPGRRDGRAVEATVLLPIVFRLN